jgi:hypothetical protein
VFIDLYGIEYKYPEGRSWTLVQMSENEILKAVSARGNQGNEVFRMIDPGKFRTVEWLPFPKPLENAVMVSGWGLVQRLEAVVVQE